MVIGVHACILCMSPPGPLNITSDWYHFLLRRNFFLEYLSFLPSQFLFSHSGSFKASSLQSALQYQDSGPGVDLLRVYCLEVCVCFQPED